MEMDKNKLQTGTIRNRKWSGIECKMIYYNLKAKLMSSSIKGVKMAKSTINKE